MEFWNESLVRVTLGGHVPSADVFWRLVDAVEASSLDIVPLRIDTGRALLDALSSGEPVRLEAEDGNLGRISDFERTVHILGLEYVMTLKVPGATTVSTWIESRNRPTSVCLDAEGRVLVDADMVSRLMGVGADHLQAYIDEAHMIGRGSAPALSALPDVVSELLAGMEQEHLPEADRGVSP